MLYYLSFVSMSDKVWRGAVFTDASSMENAVTNCDGFFPDGEYAVLCVSLNQAFMHGATDAELESFFLLPRDTVLSLDDLKYSMLSPVNLRGERQ